MSNWWLLTLFTICKHSHCSTTFKLQHTGLDHDRHSKLTQYCLLVGWFITMSVVLNTIHTIFHQNDRQGFSYLPKHNLRPSIQMLMHIYGQWIITLVIWQTNKQMLMHLKIQKCCHCQSFYSCFDGVQRLPRYVLSSFLTSCLSSHAHTRICHTYTQAGPRLPLTTTRLSPLHFFHIWCLVFIRHVSVEKINVYFVLTK